MNEEDVKIPATSEADATEATTEVAEEPVIEDTPAETLPGDKTPNNLLLKSLQEEREKRRELEEKLAAQTLTEAFSDEGKMLQSQIKKLEEDIALRDTVEKYPQLKAKKSEFDEYRSQYPQVALESVAKLFLAENDLLVAPQKRKGLEQASGGPRQPTTEGYTAEEKEDLMKNNFRKYSRLVREGKIK